METRSGFLFRGREIQSADAALDEAGASESGLQESAPFLPQGGSPQGWGGEDVQSCILQDLLSGNLKKAELL